MVSPKRNDLPIGVFDSGIGGLSVLSVLQEQLPEEEFIYLGDNANNPVGNRPIEEIQHIAETITSYLVDQKVKLIVIACNTFSVVALDYLQEQFDVPIVGMAQGISDALQAAPKGPIGVLATVATIDTHRHLHGIRDCHQTVQVVEQGCEDLAACIESGHLHDSELENCVRRYVGPLVAHQVQATIMGCTHYPLVTDMLQKVVSRDMVWIDPAYETVDHVKAVLHREQLQRTGKISKPLTIYFTAHINRVRPIVEELFQNGSIHIEEVKL